MRTKLLTIFLYVSTIAFAQTFSPERTGGIYYAYPVETGMQLDIPEEWEPFYISHYGRHGSRWLPTADRYEWVMEQFADDKNLTPFGKSVKRRLKKICRNARGHYGQLTPLGVRQHQGIARRMVENYPKVFLNTENLWVSARSSTSPRCRASMLAFLSKLPCKEVIGEMKPEFMQYLNYESPELKELTARTKRQPNISTARFVSSLFKDTTKISDVPKLLSELHTIASDMQDIPLNISLWDAFTPEEMLAVHAANDERMAICNGDTLLNEGIPARSSIALWQNIRQEADSIIAHGTHGASLRFGHDTALYRLLTLLGIPLSREGMENIIPMAANLQMVFLRRVEPEDREEVWVAFLLNERIVTFQGVPPVYAGYFYHWNDVKYVVEERIHRLEHLRQLSALNTMVGTDKANTRTAGLFGKGSEEKGQTLPAVLVPNGQTFWTPQTQDTEQKCIAPYYYRDTLFQGIRASHWLVGGCTQDYGSFTVSAVRGAKVGKEVFLGTPFGHEDEVSHPYYYAVTLPKEQLRMELTALSHAAILRVTPQEDGPLSIIVRANGRSSESHRARTDGQVVTDEDEVSSDEQEGSVIVERHQVYGFNPVHRIYQGWGERAGFSGHFVMEYTDPLVISDTLNQAVCLTFQGHKGQPIVLRMATSFTSREGAERNLHAEAAGTFWQMEHECINRWTERLHTIDVVDSDTARVNQFYGALYRASFLPREMSDVDGSYPIFSSSLTSHPSPLTPHPFPPPSGGVRGGLLITSRYGDFSMWDTYRALHPLLNIIAPKESGQMMQSLVGMAEEGGWLPIFPCWNNYTAAMIGDHCSSVLADAYVKGIRDFDVEKAYRFMRKNAFEQPATSEEYVNGMGRRALDSYLKYGYIPLEDSVKEAFHQQEQTSRTLEYAYDDFCVAQLAQALGNGRSSESHRARTDGRVVTDEDEVNDDDYQQLMRRSENWRNVINPLTGYADGRHADGSWEGNTDLVSRQPYITEGATCHYTWYVPQNIPALIQLMGGNERFVQKLDSMFSEGRYWHGNEPCHQVAWLYSLAGHPEKTRQRVSHILVTEYNNTPGGLSGNDDAGQMSAWQVFAHLGFYPVCPGTPQYVLGGAQFQQVTLNQPGRSPFVIRRSPDSQYRLNGKPLSDPILHHADILHGGELQLP